VNLTRVLHSETPSCVPAVLGSSNATFSHRTTCSLCRSRSAVFLLSGKPYGRCADTCLTRKGATVPLILYRVRFIDFFLF
jgi:hypothetical protein